MTRHDPVVDTSGTTRAPHLEQPNRCDQRILVLWKRPSQRYHACTAHEGRRWVRSRRGRDGRAHDGAGFRQWRHTDGIHGLHPRTRRDDRHATRQLQVPRGSQRTRRPNTKDFMSGRPRTTAVVAWSTVMPSPAPSNTEAAQHAATQGGHSRTSEARGCGAARRTVDAGGVRGHHRPHDTIAGDGSVSLLGQHDSGQHTHTHTHHGYSQHPRLCRHARRAHEPRCHRCPTTDTRR
jgi:hypothetical protein